MNNQVVVGYSGGADSTCLLHWSLNQNYKVIAVHLHHGIRKEADLDVEHCREACRKLNICLEIGYSDVPSLAKENKMSLEETARKVRYNFLEDMRQKYEAESVFVGHTQDDHLETMIFQMVRGSGLRGLRGLPRQNGNIKRPLWDWTRRQTEEYCNQHGLKYLNDSMNQDLNYSRVRIRRLVLPPLIGVHSGSRKSLLRLSKICYEEDNYLDEIAYQAIIKAEKKRRFDHERRFKRIDLLQLNPVLLKRGIRCIVREWDTGLTFLMIEKIVQGLMDGSKGGINTEDDLLTVHWDKEQLKFRKNN